MILQVLLLVFIGLVYETSSIYIDEWNFGQCTQGSTRVYYQKWCTNDTFAPIGYSCNPSSNTLITEVFSPGGCTGTPTSSSPSVSPLLTCQSLPNGKWYSGTCIPSTPTTSQPTTNQPVSINSGGSTNISLLMLVVSLLLCYRYTFLYK